MLVLSKVWYSLVRRYVKQYAAISFPSKLLTSCVGVLKGDYFIFIWIDLYVSKNTFSLYSFRELIQSSMSFMSSESSIRFSAPSFSSLNSFSILVGKTAGSSVFMQTFITFFLILLLLNLLFSQLRMGGFHLNTGCSSTELKLPI